jgi:hypothetical protein
MKMCFYFVLELFQEVLIIAVTIGIGVAGWLMRYKKDSR